MMKGTLPIPILIESQNHSEIALYHYANPTSNFLPVILTHGTFSNAVICAKLAEFLNSNGFECWIYEWAGHGNSKYGPFLLDAEDFALNDVPTVIKKVLTLTNKRSHVFGLPTVGVAFYRLYIWQETSIDSMK